MSIALHGINSKIKSQEITFCVSSGHSLIRLANALNWEALAALVLTDLKSSTSKGKWMLGRRLYLRIHLGVYVLQPLLKETDRGIEQRIKDTPVLQVFAGRTVLSSWHCPDHTKIEEFRNRLSPETHQKIGSEVIKTAQMLGFADPSWMDVDSTVQEANISYPSDAGLMKKLSEKAFFVLDYLQKKKSLGAKLDLKIDISKIRKKAQEYFFLGKKADQELRRKIFHSYESLVERQLKPFLKVCGELPQKTIEQLPWNIKRHLQTLREHGTRYLADVRYFMRHHRPRPGKLLAFHAQAVSCISKQKSGKRYEFGRVFQLGRIGGNFLIAFTSTSIRMEDKKSLLPVIEEHQKIFGTNTLREVGTDKGYYSKKNVSALRRSSINGDGVQRPWTAKDQPPPDRIKNLKDRRSGIEPLIGHAKNFGLRKSKMKSDRASLASGYRSVLGFNLNQLVHHIATQ